MSGKTNLKSGRSVLGETVQKDIKAIIELRGKLEKADVSGRPEAIGELITDDFVYLQPNAEGPDLYGKECYLKYLPSLDPVVK